MERLKSFLVTVSLDLAHTVRIVCGVLTATSCLLCLVAPPCGMAYTMYRVMTPLVTAGTLHLTSAMLGVTSRTVTSRGADGAKIQISIIIATKQLSGLHQNMQSHLHTYNSEMLSVQYIEFETKKSIIYSPLQHTRSKCRDSD